MSPDIEASLSKSKDWIEKNTKRFAFKKLEKQIIKSGICVECGTCVTNCPEKVLAAEITDGRYIPGLIGKCTACGVCYEMCPRTYTTSADLLGQYTSIWKVKSKLKMERKQNGGAVSAFLTQALETKSVDGVVVVQSSQSNPWIPETKIIDDIKEIESVGGTIYTKAPMIDQLMAGFRDGKSSLALVGMACHIDAANRIQKHPAGVINIDDDAEIVKIGLFCMKSFDYLKIVEFLKDNEIIVSDVERMAIVRGNFAVTVGGNVSEWPIKELEEATSRSCYLCQDLTSKNSDISCGNIGSEDDWSTVIIRTEKGNKLFTSTLESGKILAEPLDAKSVRLIMNVAKIKMEKIHNLAK
ncbi:MAG: Coenzyme F420 hydrogenase/dehydrogenase, beta subunit C-terminal domain [Candidatus Thorarchaeota archaeon]